MRTALLIWGLVLAGFAAAADKADYTGLWKGDCSDGFGLQIKPAGYRLYSVSFCGPGGCFGPEQWTPNTPLEGDPKYKIDSSTRLQMKRDNGHYDTYIRCTSDPTWVVEKPTATQPQKQLDCSLSATSQEDGVLIAWVTDVRETTQYGSGAGGETTTVEPFRPIALLKGSLLVEATGSGIRKGQAFWPVLSPESTPIRLKSASSFLDHMNEDHCVYFGTLENPKVALWTLLSSKPLKGFRPPSAEDRATFRRLNKSCVQQGDHAEGKEPPCVRPEIVAVSDINNNGKPEYWATEPYLWDTGLTVWENSGKLVPLLQVCIGCSD